MAASKSKKLSLQGTARVTSPGKQLLIDAAFYYQLTNSRFISLGKHCSWYMNVFFIIIFPRLYQHKKRIDSAHIKSSR